jgi:NADPH-dependent F420 reductase
MPQDRSRGQTDSAGIVKNMPVHSIIAIAGGTGAEGSGLALRFAKAGRTVRIGSRTPDKAEEAARRIAAASGSSMVTGHTNPEAVRGAGIVVITAPLGAQAGVLKSIHDSLSPGAILIDTTVPLEVALGGRLSRTITLWDGSAAQQAARLVPEGVPVIAAFHSLSASALADLNQPLDCDTLICGDHAESKAIVRELAEVIPGVHAIDAGPLDHARYLESAAAMLISLNLRYKVKHSGIRITGLPGAGNSQ